MSWEEDPSTEPSDEILADTLISAFETLSREPCPGALICKVWDDEWVLFQVTKQ